MIGLNNNWVIQLQISLKDSSFSVAAPPEASKKIFDLRKELFSYAGVKKLNLEDTRTMNNFAKNIGNILGASYDPNIFMRTVSDC